MKIEENINTQKPVDKYRKETYDKVSRSEIAKEFRRENIKEISGRV